MAPPQTNHKTLLKIKEYLDNGFNNKQAAKKAGVSATIVSKLDHGRYGIFPTFQQNEKLRAELKALNLTKMHVKLSKRKPLK